VKHVLVVDDDVAVRDMLCAALTAAGYQTAVAGNGKEALAQLRSGSTLPGLILLDMMMPEMTGWEFRAAQQADPVLAAIPVAIITVLANSDPKLADLRAVDVLAKPSRIEMLLAVVDRLCR